MTNDATFTRAMTAMSTAELADMMSAATSGHNSEFNPCNVRPITECDCPLHELHAMLAEHLAGRVGLGAPAITGACEMGEHEFCEGRWEHPGLATSGPCPCFCHKEEEQDDPTLATEAREAAMTEQDIEAAILEAELLASGIPARNDAECPGCAWCDGSLVGPAIKALFDAAPKVRSLSFPGLRIARAGAASSNPGGLWVTDGGGWGDSVYFGSIRADGSFRIRREVTPAIRETLRRLAAFGAAEIARIGRASGICCYCGRRLDDPVSVALGYGPVCAKHHGLPHNPAAAELAAA